MTLVFDLAQNNEDPPYEPNKNFLRQSIRK